MQKGLRYYCAFHLRCKSLWERHTFAFVFTFCNRNQSVNPHANQLNSCEGVWIGRNCALFALNLPIKDVINIYNMPISSENLNLCTEFVSKC